MNSLTSNDDLTVYRHDTRCEHLSSWFMCIDCNGIVRQAYTKHSSSTRLILQALIKPTWRALDELA